MNHVLCSIKSLKLWIHVKNLPGKDWNTFYLLQVIKEQTVKAAWDDITDTVIWFVDQEQTAAQWVVLEYLTISNSVEDAQENQANGKM